MNNKTITSILIFAVAAGAITFGAIAIKNGQDRSSPDNNPVSTIEPYSNDIEEKIEIPAEAEPQKQPEDVGSSNNTEQIQEIKMENFKNIITINTNMGAIKIETYDADAPKTVSNFITLAKSGFYDGVIFHRVIDGFMIQGGDPTGTGMGGPGYKFEDELDPATESYKNGYKKGVVAMANSGPDTNGSQFFIMVADYPLPNSYSIFGRVIEGQEVADAISKAQTNPMDRPLTDIVMQKVTVEEK
jgi:cyclophilin family peptidyl-prolyl cis-trans isomerase